MSTVSQGETGLSASPADLEEREGAGRADVQRPQPAPHRDAHDEIAAGPGQAREAGALGPDDHHGHHDAVMVSVTEALQNFLGFLPALVGAILVLVLGWIISGLGLKVNLGFYTLPLIGLGALLKLLAPGRYKELGRALAGFGTLFLGLGMLQDGMQGLAASFSLAHMPTGGYGAHLLIMLTGLALTAVLQSSTAAIAMTLTALDAGAVSFDQAAAIVVGASIGTTLTGVLVAIGGTIYAKRTAIAYILFNVIAGLLGLLILPLFLKAMYATGSYINVPPGALGLAAFHSLFIGLGAALCLPFTQQFARWVQRLVPDRSARPQHHHDHRRRGTALADPRRVGRRPRRATRHPPDQQEERPMSTLDDVLADLEAESAQLEALVADLDEGGWRTPTPAEGWDVAHQVAHLAWTDETAVKAATDKEAWDAVVMQAFEDQFALTDIYPGEQLIPEKFGGADEVVSWAVPITFSLRLVMRPLAAATRRSTTRAGLTFSLRASTS